MTAIPPLIEARGIGMAYDGRPVLRGISFSVGAGEIVCILGVSGCGKSTLLTILTGLMTPSEGAVVSNVQRPGPDLGYMIQDNPLLPWRTAAGNISLGLELSACDPAVRAARIARYLDIVQLSAFADARPHQLSGGMRQRTALARTLALEPRLLLLDEPLGSLDVPGRRRLSQVIKNYVHEKKAAAVVVTHSIEEALFLADRILLLSPRPATIAHSFDMNGAVRPTFEDITGAFLTMLPAEAGDAA